MFRDESPSHFIICAAYSDISCTIYFFLFIGDSAGDEYIPNGGPARPFGRDSTKTRVTTVGRGKNIVRVFERMRQRNGVGEVCGKSEETSFCVRADHTPRQVNLPVGIAPPGITPRGRAVMHGNGTIVVVMMIIYIESREKYSKNGFTRPIL